MLRRAERTTEAYLTAENPYQPQNIFNRFHPGLELIYLVPTNSPILFHCMYVCMCGIVYTIRYLPVSYIYVCHY